MKGPSHLIQTKRILRVKLDRRERTSGNLMFNPAQEQST